MPRIRKHFPCYTKNKTHSVLHRFLNQSETLPTRVKLVLVGAFKMHEVIKNLRDKREDKNKQIFLCKCLQKVIQLTDTTGITANVHLDDGKEGLCVIL